MFAILDGLKTRASNLKARLSAEEAAGDDAAAARTAKEMRSLADAHEEIIKNVENQPTCQLTLEVSTFGTLVMTMNHGRTTTDARPSPSDRSRTSSSSAATGRCCRTSCSTTRSRRRRRL